MYIYKGMHYNGGADTAMKGMVPMTRVRYVNKKTGWVSIYESTPHYDPDTKQSRPTRVYIGYEDPVTGEFIPSSHKPGRKTKSVTRKDEAFSSEDKKKDHQIEQLSSEITELKEEVRSLKGQLKAMNSATDRYIESLKKIRSNVQ